MPEQVSSTTKTTSQPWHDDDEKKNKNKKILLLGLITPPGATVSWGVAYSFTSYTQIFHERVQKQAGRVKAAAGPHDHNLKVEATASGV